VFAKLRGMAVLQLLSWGGHENVTGCE
jgi:hypothetical protein